MHGMSLTSIPSRIVRYFRARSPRYLAGLIAIALSVVVLCLPSAYSVEAPGPTQNVLGSSGGKQVIAVSKGKTYASKGELLLTTVNASGLPGYPVTNAEVLWSLIDPHAVVMPREVVVPTGQTADEYEKESAKEMDDSQKDAIKAAKRLLNSKGIDVSSVKATMHVDDIGGPSAGMMYALGLIDKLTPQDETGGKVIAGTGTIDAKGKVGEIGGIRLKMLGAKREAMFPKACATWPCPLSMRPMMRSSPSVRGRARRCPTAPSGRRTKARSEKHGKLPAYFATCCYS